MNALLKAMDLIQRIERFTLESKYHSTFNFVDENTLEVDCFCWNQAAAIKTIFDNKTHLVIYMESNTKLKFVSYI